MMGVGSITQSVLSRQGIEAARTLDLFLLMTAASALIFLFVLLAGWAAFYGNERLRQRLRTKALVIWGGIAFPVVTLSALLLWGFAVLGAGAAQASAEPAITIHVTGKQWWWRVVYETPEGERIESANEVRFPVGQTVRFVLTSDNVIHSFWIPAHAGKLDMIPGHTNTLHLTASQPGESRGQCAEYCGGAHALMAFRVLALPQGEFEDWLMQEASPVGAEHHPGRTAFLEAGCGACHTVRGTSATGHIGPDLTHLSSRRSLGAGILPVSQESLSHWIGEHEAIKPGNLMPPFDDLSQGDRDAMAAWLMEVSG